MCKLKLYKVKRVLQELRALNLEVVEISEIKSLLWELKSHVSVMKRLNAGKPICRSLIFKNEIPITVERISYNKNPGDYFGRATYRGKTAFYGSIATNILENYQTTPLEILPVRKDCIERTGVVSGKWVLQEDAWFIFLGSHLGHLCEDAKI